MRQRPSSRLLVLNSDLRLLLFKFEHRSGALAGVSFWATPGGEVDTDENFEQAACREMREETGLRIDDPGPQVARRLVSFRLPSGEMVQSDERFFLIRVGTLEVSAEHWTELEREVMSAHRWWTRAELAAATEQVWPEDLDGMLVAAGAWAPAQ